MGETGGNSSTTALLLFSTLGIKGIIFWLLLADSVCLQLDYSPDDIGIYLKTI